MTEAKNQTNEPEAIKTPPVKKTSKYVPDSGYLARMRRAKSFRCCCGSLPMPGESCCYDCAH
jgi:hypothetical protein